jgi:hypothetical protein
MSFISLGGEKNAFNFMTGSNSSSKICSFCI